METRSFILLGLIAASFAGSCNEKILSTEINHEKACPVSRCINAAAKSLFTPSNDVSIIVPNRSYNPNLVQKTLEGIPPKRIMKIFTKIPNLSKGRSTLHIRESSCVLIGNAANLRQDLENSFVSRWAEYIIVTETKIEVLSKLAADLWKLGFIKVAFVCVTSNEEKISLVRLIRHPSSGHSQPILVTYDLCNETSSPGWLGKDQKTAMIIPPFSTLSHTTVNTTVTFSRVLEGNEDKMDYGRTRSDGKITSLGVDVIDIFATKYNFEMMRYRWEDKKLADWTDALYACVAGEFDFFYSPQPPSRSFERGLVDPVDWYKYETLIFVDSLKMSQNSFTGLLKPYDSDLWICTLSLMGLFSLFAFCIDVLSQRGLVDEYITVLTIWSVFTVQALPRLPVRFSLRFVLGLWILHNLVTSALYTATFSSKLTAMDNGNLLRSFQDILDSGRPICTGAAVKDLFSDTNDSQTHAIYKRLEVILPKNAFNKILNEGYIASRHATYVQEHNWKNRRNDSLRLYSLADSVILTYPSFYYAKRHHPYSKEFSKLISIVREAGLIEYLNNQYTRKVRKTEDEMPLSAKEENYLKLKHLAVVFYILATGLLMSAVVFVIELYVYNRSIKQRNRRN